MEPILGMAHLTDFESAIELLIADRSPRALAGRLSKKQRGMLRAAQCIRGIRLLSPDPAFASRLRESLLRPLNEAPSQAE